MYFYNSLLVSCPLSLLSSVGLNPVDHMSHTGVSCRHIGIASSGGPWRCSNQVPHPVLATDQRTSTVTKACRTLALLADTDVVRTLVVVDVVAIVPTIDIHTSLLEVGRVGTVGLSEACDPAVWVASEVFFLLGQSNRVDAGVGLQVYVIVHINECDVVGSATGTCVVLGVTDDTARQEPLLEWKITQGSGIWDDYISMA